LYRESVAADGHLSVADVWSPLGHHVLLRCRVRNGSPLGETRYDGTARHRTPVRVSPRIAGPTRAETRLLLRLGLLRPTGAESGSRNPVSRWHGTHLHLYATCCIVSGCALLYSLKTMGGGISFVSPPSPVVRKICIFSNDLSS